MENRSIIIICISAIIISALAVGYIVYDTISTSKTDENLNTNNTTTVSENVSINNSQDTSTSNEDVSSEYPEYSPTFGHYKTLGDDFETALIETSNGNKYVLAGDGYYTYAGTDSNGNYELGSYVGKY